MSVETGKVCCNCRHNIRTPKDDVHVMCHCDIDNHYIGYVQCMEGWCRHWATDKKYWEEIEADKENHNGEI